MRGSCDSVRPTCIIPFCSFLIMAMAAHQADKLRSTHRRTDECHSRVLPATLRLRIGGFVLVKEPHWSFCRGRHRAKGWVLEGSLGISVQSGLRCGRREDRRPKIRDQPASEGLHEGRRGGSWEKTDGREIKMVNRAVGLPAFRNTSAFPVSSGPHYAPVGRKAVVSPLASF